MTSRGIFLPTQRDHDFTPFHSTSSHHPLLPLGGTPPPALYLRPSFTLSLYIDRSTTHQEIPAGRSAIPQDNFPQSSAIMQAVCNSRPLYTYMAQCASWAVTRLFVMHAPPCRASLARPTSHQRSGTVGRFPSGSGNTTWEILRHL